MSLVNILKDEFLAYFDTETVIDAEAQIVQYNVTSPEGLALTVYIEPGVNLVGLGMKAPGGTTIDIILHNITNIRCERKDGTTTFFFYQGARPQPIAAFEVEPSLYIVADIQS